MDAIIKNSSWYQSIIANNSELDVIPDLRVPTELYYRINNEQKFTRELDERRAQQQASGSDV